MRELTDPSECRRITANYQDWFTFDEDEWFSDERNYAVVEGDNLGLAEQKAPGIYWVHFCYAEARGKQAISLARRMLEDLARTKQAKTAVGIILSDNLKAKWVVRQAGFTSLIKEIETDIGLCEVFIFDLTVFDKKGTNTHYG